AAPPLICCGARSSGPPWCGTSSPGWPGGRKGREATREHQKTGMGAVPPAVPLISYLSLDELLHVGADVIQLQLQLALLFLQLLLDALQVVELLAQLSHAVGVLLAQGSGRGLVLQRCLLQVAPQLLELGLPLLVELQLH
ncbi:hypothetical protein CIB84_017010, partial [Bambusicola thoracicus]